MDGSITEPVAGFLTRKLPAEVEKFLGRLADLLDSAVTFGSHAFVFCDKGTSELSGHHHASMLLLYRHVLEMIDGVSVLVRQAAVDPCQPLLRSAMEASMGIEYMLEKETEKRALAYQVVHIRRRIREHTRNDPSTEAGKDFQKALDDDKLSSGIQIPAHASAPAIDKLAQVLAMPEYTPVDQEWERLYLKHAKAGRKGVPPWYSLFDGPRSIRQLALHLKRGGMYDTLYSNWSESVHAGGAMLTVAGRASTIRMLRHPQRAQLVTVFGVSFASEATRSMLTRYAPNKMEDWKTWYLSIRSFFQEISSREILKVS